MESQTQKNSENIASVPRWEQLSAQQQQEIVRALTAVLMKQLPNVIAIGAATSATPATSTEVRDAEL